MREANYDRGNEWKISNESKGVKKMEKKFEQAKSDSDQRKNGWNINNNKKTEKKERKIPKKSNEIQLKPFTNRKIDRTHFSYNQLLQNQQQQLHNENEYK